MPDQSLQLPVYVEHEDQTRATKHNQYFKQIKNMQKDNQVTVISHPYDLSHLVHAEKCFLTQNLLKTRKQEQEKQSPKKVVPEPQRRRRINPVKISPA